MCDDGKDRFFGWDLRFENFFTENGAAGQISLRITELDHVGSAPVFGGQRVSYCMSRSCIVGANV